MDSLFYWLSKIGWLLVSPDTLLVALAVLAWWLVRDEQPRFARLITGWRPVIPYPVDHETNPEYLLRLDLNLARNLMQARTGTKEWVGLIAYYVTGRTAALLPSGC